MSRVSKITNGLTRRLTLYHWSASLRYRGGQLRKFYRNSLKTFWDSGQRLTETNGGRAAEFVRKRVWATNRIYIPTSKMKSADLNNLEKLLTEISSGGLISQDELLPYLCLEDKSDRAQVNGMLADAYFQRKTRGSLEQAADFMKRAWLLSDFSPELLDLYLKIFGELRDIESIREAYKRLGLAAGGRGNVAEAIHYFTKWQWVYQVFTNLDRYEYDFDILKCMDQLAAPHRMTMPRKPAPHRDEKIRVGYLLRGMLDTNSNLIQISLEFARHHDRSRYEVTFFTPESAQMIAASGQGTEYLNAFKEAGYSVVMAAEENDVAATLLQQAANIRAADLHILVTSAALSDFRHYFITTLRPAPIMMGLVQGPPAQFAPPILDWCISWTRHPLIDCPTNCSWVEIKLDYPADETGESISRKSLNLPDDACVLLSAGRHTKFQNHEFWQAVVDLLTQHPNSYYVVCGARETDIPILSSVVPEQLKSRVRCLGWRQDFLQVVSTADILVDTYPNGGGQVIVQAMASGIPVVAHRNDFLRVFSQTEWSPVEDFIRDPELLVERGDFVRFKRIVSKLINDEPYRKELGERCRAEHVRVADPSKAIRGCEAVYEKVLKLFGGQ